MRLYRHLQHLPAAALGSVVAIGNFDGLHLGHQQVIGAARRLAAELHAPLAVLSFEPHPRRLFNPHLPPLRIVPLHEKLRLLQAAEVSLLFLQRFNHAFAANSAEDFIRLILVDQLKVRAVVTGEDFVFGHRRGGDAALLAAAAKNYGFTYTATPMQENEAGVISSSRIRDALAAGDMVLAAKLLGRNYTLSGRIVKGEQRGRQWGFPTANLIPSKLFYPAFGIYAVRLHLATDSYTGVANFGIRPMYPLQSPLLEAHLLDASPDLYGQQVRVELLHFLRPEARFADEDALRVQIALDCDAARQWLRSEVTSNI